MCSRFVVAGSVFMFYYIFSLQTAVSCPAALWSRYTSRVISNHSQTAVGLKKIVDATISKTVFANLLFES